MIELLIGAILLAPICGSFFAWSRFRRRVLPWVCTTWLIVALAYVGHYSYLELTELNSSDFESLDLLKDVFSISGSDSFRVRSTLALTPETIGLFLCAALVGIVELGGVTRPRDIFSGCLALFFFATSIVFSADVLMLASWIALDCVAGFLIPNNDSSKPDGLANSAVGPLIRAAPSMCLLAVLFDPAQTSIWPAGAPLGLGFWRLAGMLRFGLFCWTHSFGRDGHRRPALWALLCFGMPAIHVVTKHEVIANPFPHHEVMSYLSFEGVVLALLCIVTIAAGISALASARKSLKAIRILQICSLAIAVLGPRGMQVTPGVYLLCCHFPVLCVLNELIQKRGATHNSLTTVVVLMLVSGIWGQTYVTNLLRNSRFAGFDLGLIGLGQFCYCAAVTRTIILAELGLSGEANKAAWNKSVNSSSLCVLGIVAFVLPAIIFSPMCFEWDLDDFSGLSEFFALVAGVTPITPVLLLGALCGWYFTKPAQGLGDRIGRLCRPISSVAQNGWYLRTIVEACVSYPIRIASFVCAKLDSHVIGSSREDSWKRSASDVGRALDGVRRLDLRYSTLCGLLAIVGILLAMWWGV
jgi:hypothetical protein